MAFTATLRGDLAAFGISSVERRPPAPAQGCGVAPPASRAGAGAQVGITEAWRRLLGAPVFGTPLVLPPHPGGAGSGALVAACTVRGAMHCVSAADGSALWTAQLGAEVYAALVPTHNMPLPAVGSTECSESVALLAAARDGRITVLGAASGNVLAAAGLGEPLSAALAVQQPQQEQYTALRPGREAGPWCAACTAEGGVVLLDASTLARLDSVQLPAGLFSPPAVVGDCVVLGCRDDGLYCLECNEV